MFVPAFGDYVQISVATCDGRASDQRTVGAIALCPTGNVKGAFYFVDLKTGREIRADHWTPLPMPDLVVEVLNQLADHDDLPANRRSASTLVPGTKRAPQPRPIAVQEESSDVSSQVFMPSAVTKPTEPDPGPFETAQNSIPTDSVDNDGESIPTTETVTREAVKYLAKSDENLLRMQSLTK